MDSEVNGLLVAAHELKAPLALIRQLALSIDSSDPKLVEDYQTKLVSVSERSMKQVSDLVKFARLEDSLFELEPVAVRNVCDEVFSELNKFFILNDKKLELKYSNKSRLAIANRELLSSVIYNFCSNAIKYSSSDSVSQLAINDHKDRIRISVRDFGPALPTKIYKTFNSNALSTPVNIPFRPDSSGLGLFIATKFAHFMHANVGAVRHADGTSFFVELLISHQASLF